MTDFYYVIYKLKNEARAAAMKLLVLENELLQEERLNANTPITKNLVRHNVMSDLKKKAPELIEELGLNIPAVKIRQHDDAHPRAYEEYPFICTTVSDGETADVFVYSPIDYKGEHHKPLNAKRVPDSDMITTDFGDQVYKESAMLNGPYLDKPDRGTTMPADFAPDMHQVTKSGIEDHTYKVFIAGGSSLSCVREYLKRKQDLKEARQAIEKEVTRIAPNVSSEHLLGANEEDELEAVTCLNVNEEGKTEVWVRLENKSRDQSGHAHHSNDNAVAFKDNDYFLLEDYRNGSFKITPNRETDVGRALGRFFDRLSKESDLGQYWQLWNPTAPQSLTGDFNNHSKEGPKVPRLETIRGVHYLIYLVDKNADKDVCDPPGSIPVNTAEYLWLKDDIADEEMGIRPADPPESLSHMRPRKPVTTVPAP